VLLSLTQFRGPALTAVQGTSKPLVSANLNDNGISHHERPTEPVPKGHPCPSPAGKCRVMGHHICPTTRRDDRPGPNGAATRRPRRGRVPKPRVGTRSGPTLGRPTPHTLPRMGVRLPQRGCAPFDGVFQIEGNFIALRCIPSRRRSAFRPPSGRLWLLQEPPPGTEVPGNDRSPSGRAHRPPHVSAISPVPGSFARHRRSMLDNQATIRTQNSVNK
jgi:hypothetical protein